MNKQIRLPQLAFEAIVKVQQHLHAVYLPAMVPTSASRVAALSANSSTSHVRLLVLSTPAAFLFANSLGMVPLLLGSDNCCC